MSKNLDEIELASNLIALSGLSMSNVARSAAISPGNLSNWLRGNRTALGPEGKDRLFSNLGIVGGELDPRKIHLWTLKKGDPSPFYFIINWMGIPLELFHIAPTELSVRDYFPDRFYLPLVAYSPTTRLIVFRKISSLERQTLPFDPTSLPEGSHWKALPKDSYFQYVVQRIPNDLYDRCFNRTLSLEEFDSIARSEHFATQSSFTSWEDVQRKLEQLGFNPASALDWISKTSSLKKDP